MLIMKHRGRWLSSTFIFIYTIIILSVFTIGCKVLQNILEDKMGNLQESTHEIKIAPQPATTLSPSMEDNKEAAPPPPPNTLLPIIALMLRALALGALITLLVNLPATTAAISVDRWRWAAQSVQEYQIQPFFGLPVIVLLSYANNSLVRPC